MNLNRFFYLASSLLLCFAAFLYLSPSLISTDLIYPRRVDSLYVLYHSVVQTGDSVHEHNGSKPPVLFNPASLHLDYQEFSITGSDNVVIKGWFIPAEDSTAATILVLHDLNESKIMYLDFIQQMHDRGLNVCVYDQRAHGNSGGTVFSAGIPSILDTKLVIDYLLSGKESNHLALFGNGTGSAIAMQVALFDGRPDVLILQNPFPEFEGYLQDYAYRKWGTMRNFWYPLLHRRIEELLGFPIRKLNLAAYAKLVKTPSLFIAISGTENYSSTEILPVINASIAGQKELFLSPGENSSTDSLSTGKYYNRISEFILSALPKKPKTTRFKKLALDDQ